jgi:ribosomal protein S12 methylthiotransferase accessory factor
MWREIIHSIPVPGRAEARFADGLVIRTDHAPDDVREGRTPEPWLLFLASIGTCAASFVGDYCDRHGLPADGIRVVQRQDLDGTGSALTGIRLEIRVPPSFPLEHRLPLVEAAEACTVKRVIEAGPTFRIEIGERAS